MRTHGVAATVEREKRSIRSPSVRYFGSEIDSDGCFIPYVTIGSSTVILDLLSRLKPWVFASYFLYALNPPSQQ